MERRITLRTESSESASPELTNIVFSEVAAYRIENDSFETSLRSIDEVDPIALIEAEWAILEAGFQRSGWPGGWAVSLEHAKRFVGEKSLRAFSINSSVGLEGWVIARGMELEACK